MQAYELKVIADLILHKWLNTVTVLQLAPMLLQLTRTRGKL